MDFCAQNDQTGERERQKCE